MALRPTYKVLNKRIEAHANREGETDNRRIRHIAGIGETRAWDGGSGSGFTRSRHRF